MSNLQGSISNVEEAQGVDRVQHETTAASAQAEAPTPEVARQVEKNAVQAKEVAEKAALAAKGMGPEITGEPLSGFDVLKRESAAKTNAAVVEGQHDTQSAIGASERYFNQAKSVVGSVFASARDILRGRTDGQIHPQGSSTGIATPESTNLRGKADDVLASLQSTAGSAIGTTQQYLASAQATAQPHGESTGEALESRAAAAKAAAQLHIDEARETTHGHLGIGAKSGAVTPPASARSDRPLTNLPIDAKETSGSERRTATTMAGADRSKLEPGVG
ncbi:hypothetical protein PAXRUDRAFT_142190 [Paxillus rubicundulus Ve08.2h10]|uniref:Uncharacterized protein n=1 Tax=Paxillus rubicundulus Ve08.2h10 TaxID=930991 RepID=A0A0D0E2E9_9AGAM|nr:hypothetical protein PAXRUDRAFT_142190 [Paxillus rubicundulus Ve08.2h10]